MIENDWYVIESIFYAIRCGPKYPDSLSREEAERLNSWWITASKMVLAMLGMAKSIASQLPPELVLEKLNGEWLMRRMRESYPELAEKVEEYGERGMRWVENQAREIALFLTGRLVWVDGLNKLVPVEVIQEWRGRMESQA